MFYSVVVVCWVFFLSFVLIFVLFPNLFGFHFSGKNDRGDRWRCTWKTEERRLPRKVGVEVEMEVGGLAGERGVCEDEEIIGYFLPYVEMNTQVGYLAGRV